MTGWAHRLTGFAAFAWCRLRANQVFFVKNELESQLLAEQVIRRDELEAELEELRKIKDRLTEDQYYDQLETIMLKLARLYQSAGQDPTADEADE